jgi:hypothetical protein
MSASAQADSSQAAAQSVADFLRRVRTGIEGGLDPMTAANRAADELPQRLARSVQLLSRRVRGDYPEDEWGFDEEFAEAVYPMFEFLYEAWWRVDAAGVRNVPAHGRALLVSNHAGSLFPFDASMILLAIMKQHPLPRWARFLVLDWAVVLPFISAFMRRVGGVPASKHNAARLLEQDEVVMVFPEGVKGTGKQFSERYRLQRFGRGGFVEVALRTGSPIIPVAVVGSDLPEARECEAGGARSGSTLRADHAHIPLAGAPRPGPVAVQVANRVLRADRPLPPRARRGG